MEKKNEKEAVTVKRVKRRNDQRGREDARTRGRASTRLLLVGVPALTAGAAAYAALASDFLRGYSTLKTLPLIEMGESWLGAAVILLMGALMLELWR